MSDCGLQEEEDEDFILDEPIDMSECGLQEEEDEDFILDFILDEPIDDVEDSVDEPIDDVEDSDDEPIEKDFLPDVEDSDDEPDDEPIDDFPANFKDYMERELKYSRLEIFDKPPGSKSRSLYTWEGIRWVFWNPQDDDLTLSSDQSVDFITNVCASRKVRHALHKLILHPELSNSLVQFWASTKTTEGRTLLTTQFQPFAIGKLALNSTMHLLCEYRMGMCREYNNYFYADAESEKEELGLPGRVFLNKLPESTPLVELYTLKEYPQRDLALRCKIKVSWAVPVLEHSSHTCVGVLEFVSRYNNMSMNWFDMIFRGSMYDIFQDFGLLCFDGYKHYKMQNGDKNKVLTAAFQELKMVCESVCKIHYIPLALAWASCPSCNDLLQIQFQLSALDYVYVIDSEDVYFYSDLRDFLDASKFCHLRKRQVTEKILQFPNLLYCSDVKQCSIAESPLVPYARFCDLSGWFTMCLQSSYTRDELYVLEFFLPESNENDENILTKLRLILGTMEEYFETFKLASGQELREVLSVEVIDLQNYSRSHSIQMIPATRSIPSLELLEDGGVILQQGQLGQPSMDPSSNGQNVVTVERNILVVPSSKERKRKMQDRKHKKAGVRIEVSLEEILKCSNMKREDAARELKVSVSTFKRVCRGYDIHRWPPRNIENANSFRPSPVENQRQIPQLNSDLPSNQALAGVSHIKPGFQDADMVTIRAKYENNKIKFRLPLSSRFVELQEQVAKKLNLEAGTYCVKYKDEEDEEDELTLITCDEDLQDCMHTSRSPGKASVVVFLELKQPITNLNPGLHGRQHTLFSPLRNQGQTCHFIDQFPEPIRPYIESVKDVEPDGNCGFRAISAFINEDCNEHEWKQVRIDLLRELVANFDLYERVALRSGSAGELRCILNWNESPAPQAKWMTMPDMGHLIASTYNCVLIHLSKLQCLTFLPLQSKPLPSIKRKVIAIGFVNGGHFVQVFLKKGSPMPPIACNWTIYRDSIAKNWDVPYVKAIQKFKEIIGNDVATKEVIDVD